MSIEVARRITRDKRTSLEQISAGGQLHIFWSVHEKLLTYLSQTNGGPSFVSRRLDQERPAKGAPRERLEHDALWRYALLQPDHFWQNIPDYSPDTLIYPLAAERFTTTYKEMTIEENKSFKCQLLIRICITSHGELWLEEYQITPCHGSGESDFSYIVTDTCFVHLNQYQMTDTTRKLLEKTIRSLLPSLLLGMRSVLAKEIEFHKTAMSSARTRLRITDDTLNGIEHLWVSAN